MRLIASKRNGLLRGMLATDLGARYDVLLNAPYCCCFFIFAPEVGLLAMLCL